jgi:hypothetical protein
MAFLAALLISSVILGGNVWAQAIGLPLKALYGFSPKHRAFRNKTPEQMAQTLEQWGITAVFGGRVDH